MKLRLLITSAALFFGLGAAAQAAPGFATGNVNMRLGPSTDYAVIDVVPQGASVNIIGCLQGYSWCDVAFAGQRGWVSSRYLQRTGLPSGPRYVYRGGPNLGIPFITFDLFAYHGDHYRDRPWYRDRYYDRYWGSRRDWRDRDRDRDRREWRRERREERRDRTYYRSGDAKINGRPVVDILRDEREFREEMRERQEQGRPVYTNPNAPRFKPGEQGD